MVSLREIQIELQKNLELLRQKDEVIEELEDEIIIKEAAITKLREELEMAKLEFRRLSYIGINQRSRSSVHQNQNKSKQTVMYYSSIEIGTLHVSEIYDNDNNQRSLKRTSSTRLTETETTNNYSNFLTVPTKSLHPLRRISSSGTSIK